MDDFKHIIAMIRYNQAYLCLDLEFFGFHLKI